MDRRRLSILIICLALFVPPVLLSIVGGVAIATAPAKTRSVWHSMLGSFYVGFGNEKQAFANFARAIELDPQNREAYIQRAELYEQENKLSEAIADYKKAAALEGEPLTPSREQELHAREAELCQRQGRFEEAIADYSEALKSARKIRYIRTIKDWLLVKRGTCYALLGDFERADADFESALEVNETNTVARFYKALLEFRQEHYEESARICQETAEAAPLDPDAPYAVLIGAIADLRLKREKDARQLLSSEAAENMADGWPKPLIKYYEGKLKLSEVLTDATEPRFMIEAKVYAGLLQSTRGETEAARENFAWAEEHPQYGVFDCSLLAGHESSQLSKASAANQHSKMAHDSGRNTNSDSTAAGRERATDKVRSSAAGRERAKNEARTTANRPRAM